ncbi:MAG: type II secretion system protein [Patescibacteria group bacterium]
MNKGFTLIEIVLVIAIMAILSSLVLIFSYGIKIRKDLDSTINSLAAVIRDAQQKSITQEDMKKWGVFLEADTATNKYFYSLIRDSKTDIVTRYQVPIALEFDTSLLDSFGGGQYEKEVTFTQLEGLPGLSDVVIKIRIANDPSSAKQITIYTNGTVSY